MIEELEIILETTSKILQKHVNHGLRQNIVPESTGILNLWKDIEQNGLPKISVKEKFGGYEIPFFSILPLIKMINNYGTPLPLSETILSNYILSESDINPPNGIVTFATNTKNIQIENNMLSGDILSVPYLNLSKNLLIIHEFNNVKQAILISEINGEITHKKNFLAEPRCDIKVTNLNIAVIKPIKNNIDFNFLGAILRSTQMIGAMEKVLDLSINYCSERKQFGRALSKFQAIQHQIADMAVELSASSAALSAITDLDLGDKNYNDIAISKIRAGAAAGKLIAISHQVHGAIGFTKEYELSYFTKNLNSWRNDFGNESFWEDFLGKRFLEKSNENLWEYLT